MKTAKILVGDIGCNMPAASGAPVTIKGKWCLSAEGTMLLVIGRDPFLDPLDLRTLLHVTSTYVDM
jgi:hypothetical protein